MNRSAIKLLFFPALLVLNACTYTFYQAECHFPVAGGLHRSSVLSDEMIETSGLDQYDSCFYSFNDSGGEPVVFGFCPENAAVNRIPLPEAQNRDWETMALDNNYLYIGDVGNNFGSRDTLLIYRYNVGILESSAAASPPQLISLSYNEPVTRNERGFISHDCEAMFVYGDSLYLFAKDWVTMDTRIYVLPAAPGHYDLSAKQTYHVRALITGADIDPDRREVVLVGYRNFMPVIIRYSFDTNPALIACGGKARIYPRYLGTQVEGVSFDYAGRVWVTSEKALYKQSLYRVN